MEYLRATSDEEMGKIGPSPPTYPPQTKPCSGGPLCCDENRPILRCRPRLWPRHSLRIPPRLHPTNDGPVRGGPGLDRFSCATQPARKLITGSSVLSLQR